MNFGAALHLRFATIFPYGSSEISPVQHENLPRPVEQDYGLFLINFLLQEQHSSLQDVPSPPPYSLQWNRHVQNPLLFNEQNLDREALLDEAARLSEGLNEGQRYAYDSVVDTVLQNQQQLFFLAGSGGTGKTYLYITLCAALRSQGKIVICVASTGIAAQLLPGGQTSHSRFKIPIDIDIDMTCGLKKQSHVAGLLRECDAVIWDEVSPQNRHQIEAVDKCLKDIRDSEAEFGGLTVVFGGDWAQTLPVLKNERPTAANVIEKCLVSSPLWPKLEKLRLSENMRLRTADLPTREYIAWLDRLAHDPTMRDFAQLPRNVHTCADEANLIQSIYPAQEVREALRNPETSNFFAERSILCAKNDEVHAMNERIIDMLPSDDDAIASYVAKHEPIEGTPPVARAFMTDEVMSLHQDKGIPPANLRLRRGMCVMLLRNLNVSRGLCNGSRLIILRHSRRELFVRVVNGQGESAYASIPRIWLEPDAETTIYPFRRLQFPVRPCFTMTINKSQGQSPRAVGIDMRVDPFLHGQTYVAFSRASDVNGVHVLLLEDSRGRVKNVVYPEIYRYT